MGARRRLGLEAPARRTGGSRGHGELRATAPKVPAWAQEATDGMGARRRLG
jgi:hypothetical protein